MGKKNLVVIGILLIVLIVTAGIAYQNSEYVKLIFNPKLLNKVPQICSKMKFA